MNTLQACNVGRGSGHPALLLITLVILTWGYATGQAAAALRLAEV
jgi:hypothetical protein